MGISDNIFLLQLDFVFQGPLVSTFGPLLSVTLGRVAIVTVLPAFSSDFRRRTVL